jgi:N-acetylmuramic acid 6-phosphate etherase
MPASEDACAKFLATGEQFQLGHLMTEGPHPKTVGLSQLIRLNPDEAIKAFVSVDQEMLEALVKKSHEIHELSQKIEACFNKGGRLFLSGCGATGRLSLVIENIWRQLHKGGAKEEQVIGFMAGGDLALIHSIEKFEDYPDYGKRQLIDLGFSNKDLLLASTEGGETPWVIGTALAAHEIGGECVFLYCNPRELLIEKLERCREVFRIDEISKLELVTGPQALTGSTRLQASSILTAAIGCALFHGKTPDGTHQYLERLKDWYLALAHKKVVPLIQKEAQLYNDGRFVYYTPSQSLAISVLTDTTERSPTFNLRGFDNKQDNNHPPSWCYLAFPGSKDAAEAWRKLLYREPRALIWPEVEDTAGHARLLGFDFSREVFNWRNLNGKEHEVFKVWQKEDQLLFELGDEQAFFSVPKDDLLASHLILKMLLNMHSTLLMGLMGRYESNVMTWVRPSNYKLVDRTVRYASQLLKEKGFTISYEALVKKSFEIMGEGVSEKPIVLRLVEEFGRH